MTQDERESIIVQLALIEGVNKSVFEKYTDEGLKLRMQQWYEEEKDGQEA